VAKPSDKVRKGPYVYPKGPYDHIVAASGQDETMMWCVERDGGGRGFGFTGGHRHKNWGNENHRKVVLNALVWLCKLDVPAGGVASTVTEEELQQNLDPRRNREETDGQVRGRIRDPRAQEEGRGLQENGELGRRTWMKYGALEYFECSGDDLKVQKGCGLGFPKGARLKADETVVFAFIIYKSKSHRDAVNKKVMADPSMKEMPPNMPFDVNRMMLRRLRVFVEG
jgi:uncharacterized protein YbaA (DUF1428 family)